MKVDYETAMKTIRVIHVEDYKIMRDGVRYLLEQDARITIVGDAGNSEEMMKRLQEVEADVVILDIYLDALENPNAKNGLQLCWYLQENYPHLKIIIHSTYDDAQRVSAALAAGARGFVSKRSGFDSLSEAVRTVASGGRFICDDTRIRMRNLNEFLLGVENHLRDKVEVFTQRERQVLLLLAAGHSSKQIADELSITERTVESHRKNMMEKCQAKNTVELVAYASGLGIIKK